MDYFFYYIQCTIIPTINHFHNLSHTFFKPKHSQINYTLQATIKRHKIEESQTYVYKKINILLPLNNSTIKLFTISQTTMIFIKCRNSTAKWNQVETYN